jgi:sarcosine oxidase subunit alpha
MTKPSTVQIFINGTPALVPSGSVVSAALLSAGVTCRKSVSGEARSPLCGMGICFECCAVVDGVQHTRTCQLLCRQGMRVETES